MSAAEYRVLMAAMLAASTTGYLRANPDVRRRARLSVHVLRGRPAAYRLDMDGVMHARDHTYVMECTFKPGAVR